VSGKSTEAPELIGYKSDFNVHSIDSINAVFRQARPLARLVGSPLNAEPIYRMARISVPMACNAYPPNFGDQLPTRKQL